MSGCVVASCMVLCANKSGAQSSYDIYVFDANPGGSVPAWLANNFADKGPYESFKKLAEMLKNP